MSKAAKEVVEVEVLDVVADRGYYNGGEILECERSGITPHVPKTLTSNSLSKGLFDKRDFKYIRKDDEYVCPAGERLTWRMRTMERGRNLINIGVVIARPAPLSTNAPQARAAASAVGNMGRH